MNLPRRDVLKVGAGFFGGALLISCKKQSDGTEEGIAEPSGALAKGAIPQELAGATAAWSDLGTFVRVSTTGEVTVIVAEAEMGQGVMTSIPMIVAEELSMPWKKVRAEMASSDSKYGNQGTGGSTSIRTGYPAFQVAGAVAREMLLEAAAGEFKVPKNELTLKDGQVVHAKSGKKRGMGTFAESAAKLKPPESPRTKSKNFQLIGKSLPRLDLTEKVTGAAKFGLDMLPENALVAVLVRSPTIGGIVRSFDDARSKKVAGVHSVVQVPAGVAVLGDHFWAAKKGAEALEVRWKRGPNAKMSSGTIRETLKAAAKRGKNAENKGNVKRDLKKGATRIKAIYELPYLAHATMEPLNCTVHAQDDRCDVWVGTQTPTASKELVAYLCELPEERVFVHQCYLGGGFGRRSNADFVADAVHIALEVDRPVKLVFTREDDMRRPMYRPAAYNEVEAALDGDGAPTAWRHRIASPSIQEAFGPLKGGIDENAVEGAIKLPYLLGSRQIIYSNPKIPVDVWYWRSVGHSLNAFVTECFLDELAEAGGQDPLAFREKLLRNSPRHWKVLKTAADRAGWGKKMPSGRAQGLALHESFGSIAAEVAEVSIENGVPHVHRVVCAIDCGRVINPDIVRAQMESSIIYGLSAALFGKITIEKGAVVEGNFDRYRMVRMSETPVIETDIIESGGKLGGVGEPGTPPIAPAVANAMFSLTGERVRKLPIVDV